MTSTKTTRTTTHTKMPHLRQLGIFQAGITLQLSINCPNIVVDLWLLSQLHTMD